MPAGVRRCWDRFLEGAGPLPNRTCPPALAELQPVSALLCSGGWPASQVPGGRCAPVTGCAWAPPATAFPVDGVVGLDGCSPWMSSTFTENPCRLEGPSRGTDPGRRNAHLRPRWC